MIEVKSLSVRYGKKEILDQVSFSLKDGTVTALLGANGCGKTTLLKSLCGLIPYEGTCLLDGADLREMTSRQRARQIAYIPQRSGISIELTAMEAVLMGFNPQLRLLQQPTKAMQAQAEAMLATFGIAPEAEYLTLSEGQKQLCCLARAMVSRGRCLLLDEPESALDVHNRYEMFDALRRWMEDRAVLAALHDPQLALQTANAVILLKDRKLHAVLSPKKDSLETMERALCGIYGAVRLHRIDGTLVMVRQGGAV